MMWHILLPLMNSVNQTGAAIFLTRIMLPEDFIFFSDECFITENIALNGLSSSLKFI